MFITVTIFDIVLVMTGLFCLWRQRPVFLLLVLLINCIDLCNENIIIINCHRWWRMEPNVFYNIYSLLEILTWMAVFMMVFKSRQSRRIIGCMAAATLVYSLLELIMNGLQVFHSGSYAVFSGFCLCLATVYLLEVNRKEFHRIKEDPAFWICASAICFHAVFLVNLATMLDKDYWSHTGAQQVFHLLQSWASIISDLLVCIAFIISFCRYQQPANRGSS